MLSSLHTGGAERVAATLSNAWTARGDTVALVPTYSGKGECCYRLDPGVDLIYLADQVPGRCTGLMKSVRRLLALRKLVQQWQPDVIVSFLTNVNVAALIATRGLAVPVIVCERTHPASSSAGASFKQARRWMYRWADAVAVQTDATATALQAEVSGIRRLVVVPNPLPSDLTDAPLAVCYQPSAGTRKLLMAMGRLVPAKQFDLLIDVFAQLAAAHPDWDLCIWGDGPERATLQTQIAARKMAGRIVLAGRTDSPWDALSQGQAFVLCSKVEGFPNALLEAMALGLPCVAFDCPSGPRDISRNGQDALLVPLSDRHALAQALAQIMTDSTLRVELGERAAKEVRKRYALEGVLSQWDEVFTQVGARQNRSLSVLHVITGLGQGGAEAVLCRLVEASSSPIRHVVVSLTDEGVHSARLRAAGAQVHALGMQPGRVSWRGLRDLHALMRDSGCRVVQTWMYHADLIGGVMARLCGLRAVAWGIRNSGAQLTHASRSARWVMHACAMLSRRVPAAIVCCAEAARTRHTAAGYASDRMLVIRNGYDLSRVAPQPHAAAQLREAWGCDPDIPLIGCVARWHPLKDHANLFNALALLRERLPGLRCALVGTGMVWDNSELAALADSLSLRDTLILLGERDDVPAIMSALDMHVLPSRAEGFPNVVAEAMACGTPCVVTDVGDAADIVGELGWVVVPENPQALADAIAAAWTGKDAARATACRARVHARFSLSAMADAYVTLWRRLARRSPPRLLFVIANPAFFLSHRLPLAEAARDAGYDVHVATMKGASVADIVARGFTHHLVPMSRTGRNPIEDIVTLYALWRVMRRVRPDVVHLVTIKSVLYGGIAARLARVPGRIAAIAGLGFVFTRRAHGLDLLRTAVTVLYRLALGGRGSRVIFQNDDDRAVLSDAKVVRAEQTVLIRGSGVDLSAYQPRPEPSGFPIVVSMAARLLRDKGVHEFVAAARLLHARGLPVEFRLAGSIDPPNPASLTEAELAAWRREGVVTLLGERDDIAEVYGASHIVVLPSYREGLPRALVEAAACARPVVTSDTPGCRDAIEPDVTGLLVPVRDAQALADAIASLADNADLRARMGAAGRSLAEREFGIDRIAAQHLDLYQSLSGRIGVSIAPFSPTPKQDTSQEECA